MEGVLVTVGMQNLRRNFKGWCTPFKVESGTELNSSGLRGKCFHLPAVALASFTRLKKKLYAHADVLVLLHKLNICTWVSRWPALSPEAMLISLTCAAPEGYGGVLGPCRMMAVLMSVVCITIWGHAELFATFYCLQRPYVSPWSMLPWL